MPAKKTKPRQETFDVTSLLVSNRQPEFVKITATDENFCKGDKLLIDRQRKPRENDWIVWKESGEDYYHVCRYSRADWTASQKRDELYGVVVYLIRDFNLRPKRNLATRTPQENPQLAELKKTLARLERVPENEAIAFQMESEIYRLEQESSGDEWPDVVGEVPHA